MASIMGKGSWWSVPVSILIDIPMYSHAPGVIPIVEALLGKGAIGFRSGIYDERYRIVPAENGDIEKSIETPSVIVDGVMKCLGKVPKKEEIKTWLTK